MNEGAVQSRIGIRAQDGNALLLLALNPGRFPGTAGACQVRNRAGNDRDVMAFLHQEARQLMVTCSAWFIQSGKSLVDQQDMHTAITFIYDARSHSLVMLSGAGASSVTENESEGIL